MRGRHPPIQFATVAQFQAAYQTPPEQFKGRASVRHVVLRKGGVVSVGDSIEVLSNAVQAVAPAL